jgi:hypothetical protein
MTKPLAMLIVLAASLMCPQAYSRILEQNQGQNAAPDQSANVLKRRYKEGETLAYHMKGSNENWRYEIDATGVVKKDSAGRFVEEYAWSNFSSNRPGDTLPAATATFRQSVSLDLARPAGLVPDLRPLLMIVGPITDLLTFYADLQLGLRQSNLKSPGDHSYIKIGGPNSWADGSYVLIGEDSIDFDLTLKDVSKADGTATLVVRHVPPEKPKIKVLAPWMNAPVAGAPNNWVQLEKRGEGKYIAAIGKETFEVEIKVSLSDGKILSAKIDNPVEVLERECSDRDLANCGEPRRYQILRQIEMDLKPR